MQFLIVDNAPAVRMALAKNLTEFDPLCEIKEAETIAQALALTQDWRPSVVFTGMGLAGGDRGIKLVEELLRRDPKQTIVLCTSMPKEHPEVGEALSMGAFAYLPKPVRHEAVRHVMNEYSEERGGLRRIR